MSESTGIKRRDFLKGAAVAGGIAAAAGTVQIATAEEAPAEFVPAQVPANLEYEQKILSLFPNAQPIAPAEPPAAWDKEYDVVVVGSGAGGLAAAIRLQESGKTACVVEKMVFAGGNSQYSSYFKCHGGTKVHEAAGLGDYQTYREAMVPAVVDALYEDLLHQSKSRSFLWTALVDSPRACDWLMDDLGFDLEFDKGFEGNVGTEGVDASRLTWHEDDTTISSARNYPALVRMAEIAQERGADLMLETECKTLVMEGDKVVGIKAEGPDGELFLRGAEGVILAGGGCIDNPDMHAVFIPTLARVGGTSMTNGSDTGECIRMGMGAGAAVSGRDSFTGNDGGPAWEIHGSRNFNLYGGWTQVGGQPWMTIDRYGELQKYYGTGEFGEIANLKQDRLEIGQQNYRVYKIIDSKYADYVETFGQKTWRIPLTKDMPGIEKFPALTDWREGMEWAIESGTLPQADTIEELAERVGIKPEVMVKAVEEWNALCDAGEGAPDLNFPAEWMHRIDTPPYYVFALGFYNCATGFGLRVDNYLRVISAETDEPIEGLYAACHTAAGFCENSYAMSSIINNATLSLWSGWRAANQILGIAED